MSETAHRRQYGPYCRAQGGGSAAADPDAEEIGS
jgi:hypothetical protein